MKLRIDIDFCGSQTYEVSVLHTTGPGRYSVIALGRGADIAQALDRALASCVLKEDDLYRQAEIVIQSCRKFLVPTMAGVS